MAFINGKLLLPISILQTLVENCGVKFIAKYNNLYIKYAGVVGISEGTFFGGSNYDKDFSGVFEDDVYETVYITGFIEHIEGSALKSTADGIFKPQFKLCKFSNVKNIPYESSSKHELLLTKNFNDISLSELYYCNIEEYVDWLRSLGQEVPINDVGLYMFINKIFELMPECSIPNSKSAENLALVFHDLWGIDAEQTLRKLIHEIPSKDEPSYDLKNHKYLTALNLEEAALIACNVEDFATIVQFHTELKKWASKDGSLAPSMQLEGGNIMRLPQNYRWETFDEVNAIANALRDELYCAMRWFVFNDTNRSEVYWDEETDSRPPNNETLITLSNFDYSIDYEKIKITKESLSAWFLQNKEVKKASIFSTTTLAGSNKINLLKKTEDGMHIPKSNLTPWLSILIEAIHQNFPEDREIDPKKANVVEWILEKAKKEGIAESENIANAIFTIIKPQNHNPKKRKG
jgi:hypothetical protein